MLEGWSDRRNFWSNVVKHHDKLHFELRLSSDIEGNIDSMLVFLPRMGDIINSHFTQIRHPPMKRTYLASYRMYCILFARDGSVSVLVLVAELVELRMKIENAEKFQFFLVSTPCHTRLPVRQLIIEN